MAASSSEDVPSWTILTPDNFSDRAGQSSRKNVCRFAKDDQYLNAVLKMWNHDITERDIAIETRPLTYVDGEQNPLYGHVVRKVDSEESKQTPSPGILLFHTAAGPQDVFLFYKASLLAKAGFIVLICDILSDANGWAWSSVERTRYTLELQKLAYDDHRLLRSRVEASIRAVTQSKDGGAVHFSVDKNRLAMLGWCLGAQPILEAPRVQTQASDCVVRVLVTFHGVFRRDTPLTLQDGLLTSQSTDCKVLICNGIDDPFVKSEDLEQAKAYFESANFQVDIAQFNNARHGFTNPAQSFNGNDAFDYHESAASRSWEMTMKLLRQNLALP